MKFLPVQKKIEHPLKSFKAIKIDLPECTLSNEIKKMLGVIFFHTLRTVMYSGGAVQRDA